MRTLIIFLLFFIAFNSSAQDRWTDSFAVKTDFHIGEIQAYDVSEFLKVENMPFIGSSSEIKTLVQFKVTDTLSGGYIIHYTVQSKTGKESDDYRAKLLSKLVDGLDIELYVKDRSIIIDSFTYRHERKRIERLLESLTDNEPMNRSNRQFIDYLYDNITGAEGLTSLLVPLKIFTTYYSAGVFKKFRLTYDWSVATDLGQPLYRGKLDRQIEKVFKDSSVELSMLFTADPLDGGRYYKTIYGDILYKQLIFKKDFSKPTNVLEHINYRYITNTETVFPKYLYKKIVSEYVARTVGKVEMKENEISKAFREIR